MTDFVRYVLVWAGNICRTVMGVPVGLWSDRSPARPYSVPIGHLWRLNLACRADSPRYEVMQRAPVA